jgi:class 3 adenylate cyclase
VTDDTHPDRPHRPETDLRTFLIADVRGYTRFTQEHGDEAASGLARQFAEIVRAVVPIFGGELLELRGDEALCVFGSARQALRAAVELQRSLRTPADGGNVFPLGVGVGLDAGEAVPTEGGYRGRALNAAARLCAAAQAGDILATQTVVMLAGRVDGVRYGNQRRIQAKGIDSPVVASLIVPEVPLPPLPPTDRSAHAGRRSARRLAFVGAVVVLAASLLTVWLIARDDGQSSGPPAIQVRGNSVAEIDPVNGRVVADIPVNLGGGPAAIAVREGYVWTFDASSQTLYRITASNHHVDPYGISVGPTDIVATPGKVWVVDPHKNVLVEIDAITPTVRRTINLDNGHGSDPSSYTGNFNLSVGRTGIWVSQATGMVEVSPATAGIIRRILPGSQFAVAADVAASGDSLWVVQFLIPTHIVELAPGSGRISIPSNSTSSPQPGDLTVGFGFAWYAVENHVWKISPSPVGVADSIPVTGDAEGIALGPDAVWVADVATGTVLRIDPSLDKVMERIQLHHGLSGIAVGDGHVWVGVLG